MQIHELPEITSISSGGYLATDNGTQTTKIDYAKLAKAIIEQYSGSTLAGSAQSVKAALDGINSNINNLGTVETKDVIDVALPNATFVTLTSITLSPGTYILTGNVNFDQNPSGIRIVMIETTESAQNNQLNSTLATGRSTLEYVRMIVISSQTTLYFRAFQNSGTTMSNISAILKAMKIK